MAYWRAYLSWSIPGTEDLSGSVLGGFLFRAANHTELNPRGNEALVALNGLLSDVLTSAPPGAQEFTQLGAWVIDDPLVALMAWWSLPTNAKNGWVDQASLDALAEDFFSEIAWDGDLKAEVEAACRTHRLPDPDVVARVRSAVTQHTWHRIREEVGRYEDVVLAALRGNRIAPDLCAVGAAIPVPWAEPAEDWSKTLAQLVDAAVERVAHMLLTPAERHVVDVFVGVRPPPHVRRGSQERQDFETVVRGACVNAKRVTTRVPILYDLRKRDSLLVVVPEKFDHADHAAAFSLADLLAGSIRRSVAPGAASWQALRGVVGARADGTWLAERIPLALRDQLPRPAVAAAGPARQAVSEAFDCASKGALPPLLVGPGWAWDQASSWGEFAKTLGELAPALCADPPQAQAAAAVVRAMLETLVEGDLRHPTDSSSMTVPDRDRPAIVETVFTHVMNDAKRGQPPYSGYEGFRKELKRRLAQTYFWHNEPRS